MNGKENQSLGVKGAVRLEGVGRELWLFFYHFYPLVHPHREN